MHFSPFGSVFECASKNFARALAQATEKDLLVSQYTETRALLIPACENAEFHLDTAPPYTRRVAISFDLRENGGMHSHEVNVALRGWGGNLLTSDGTALASDDD